MSLSKNSDYAVMFAEEALKAVHVPDAPIDVLLLRNDLLTSKTAIHGDEISGLGMTTIQAENVYMLTVQCTELDYGYCIYWWRDGEAKQVKHIRVVSTKTGNLYEYTDGSLVFPLLVSCLNFALACSIQHEAHLLWEDDEQ